MLAIEGVHAPTNLRVDLTRRQALAMRYMFDGLQSEGAMVSRAVRKLASGEISRGERELERPHDSVRWLLDQIADGAGIPWDYPFNV